MRRLGAASIIAVVLVCLVAACTGLTGPAQQRILCGGALYCGSSSVPQLVSGGTCCAVVDFSNGRALPNATVGYLCAYGSGRAPAGCAATLDQARFICPTAPSIVRCTTE
jgi:hypothetical protein